MWLPTKNNIDEYKLLKVMLFAQKQEFDLLSKKKLDGQLNKMKIQMVNRVLEPLYKLFANEPSHEFLEILNETDMPTNSDVVLIISQYIAALTEFKSHFYKKDKNKRNGFGSFESRWMTKEEPPEFYAPRKSSRHKQ